MENLIKLLPENTPFVVPLMMRRIIPGYVEEHTIEGVYLTAAINGPTIVWYTPKQPNNYQAIMTFNDMYGNCALTRNECVMAATLYALALGHKLTIDYSFNLFFGEGEITLQCEKKRDGNYSVYGNGVEMVRYKSVTNNTIEYVLGYYYSNIKAEDFSATATMLLLCGIKLKG